MATATSHDHHEILRINKHEIAEKLTLLSLVLDKLVAFNAITSNDMRNVAAERTDCEKATALVELLQRKSDKAFLDFITVLRETKQDYIADMLEGIYHYSIIK